MASRKDDVKRLSLQAMKLMEDYCNNVTVDVSDTVQPLLREWKSVQELTGVSAEEKPSAFDKLKRLDRHSVGDEHDLEEQSEVSSLGQLRRFATGSRRYSFGSENSLDARDRRPYEYSMDTLWSSSSTFFISGDAKDGSQDNWDLGSAPAMGSGDVFSRGSDDMVADRPRQGTVGSDGGLLEPDQCRGDSVETVTAEPPAGDPTGDEVREVIDDILDRIYSTYDKLASCSYAPEDTEEEVELKLKECKVTE